MSELLSIVTVSYNQGEFIRQNIESVLAQDYGNVEHIVIDAGSTDNTLKVLEEYKHLRWISEPDRGQSHALNKGFRMARGQYIGWLNSDDWYAANVFNDVVQALRTHPVVMGGCQRSDRDGKCIEHNPNVPRNFYDILKYWVMKSTPDQPSVFFRKQVIDEVAHAPGLYLDEELDYCMDVELWLRIAKRYEFNKSIDRLLVYFRDHDASKGGTNMAAAYRETSRIFARHSRRSAENERALSVVIPASSNTPELATTLEALSKQILQDLEIVVVDYGESAKSRSFKKQVVEYGAQYQRTCIRFVSDHEASRNCFSAINAGIKSAKSPSVAVLQPGVVPGIDFSFHAVNLMRIDLFGLALILNSDKQLADTLSIQQDGAKLFNIPAILSAPLLAPNFIIRKVAALELGSIRSWQCPLFAIRELLLRISYKSWQVSVDNQLTLLSEPRAVSDQQDFFAVMSNYINARLFLDLDKEYRSDPFAETRTKTGINLHLPVNLIEHSQQLLSKAPAMWETLSLDTELEELEELVKEHPQFSPAWYLLARKCQDSARATQALDQFKSTQQSELV